MFLALVLLIIFFIYTYMGQTYTVHDLAGKKYVLVQTDDAFAFNETKFLYHVFDLDSILKPYLALVKDDTNSTACYPILIRKIKALHMQLKQRKIERKRRALNFLGTAISWLTGVPDHDDMMQIKVTLNELIENNNQQQVINDKLWSSRVTPTKNNKVVLLEETLYKLQIISQTINLAKNQQFFSQSMDLNDLNEIIKYEKIVEIPLLDIMEYADIHVCQIENKIICIYKYPIITDRCKHFEIVPLAYEHGKIKMDNEVMRCGEQFVRAKNCKNNFRYNICQKESDDNCTTNVLNNIPSTCNILEENNEKIQTPEDGYVILDGSFRVNNESVEGTNLIEFKNNVTIDDKLYVNHKEELKEIIKKGTMPILK